MKTASESAFPFKILAVTDPCPTSESRRKKTGKKTYTNSYFSADCVIISALVPALPTEVSYATGNRPLFSLFSRDFSGFLAFSLISSISGSDRVKVRSESDPIRPDSPAVTSGSGAFPVGEQDSGSREEVRKWVSSPCGCVLSTSLLGQGRKRVTKCGGMWWNWQAFYNFRKWVILIFFFFYFQNREIFRFFPLFRW